MSKQKNPIWNFFASVKLALATLIILAATSIIGTIIKQGQPPEYYLTEYGEANFQLFEALQLTRMYSSWWYIALLSLFALNLLICSIERLPAVWRIITQDNLLSPPQNLEKMSCSHRQVSKISPAAAAEQVAGCMTTSGWKSIRKRADDDAILLFVQKGAWTRLGVYVVHLSILIILAGVIIGGLFGFQAYVYLPEGRTTKNVFERHSQDAYPMGFDLRGDRYEKSYYPSGMVKQYHADLTVLDPELGAPYQKSIIVNDPLSYKGLTFYLGDNLPTQEFFIEIINRSNGLRQAFRIPPEQLIEWPEANISLQVEQLDLDQDGNARRGEIALQSTSGSETASIWIADRTNQKLSLAGQTLDIYFRQANTILLLVSKDPGVATVYTGCIAMLIGLTICLCFSHRRIWIKVTPQEKGQSLILVGGVSNKNKLGFEQSFHRLKERIANDSTA